MSRPAEPVAAGSPSRIVYRARWVVPIDSPPLAEGIVEVEDGIITAVHNRPDPRAVDLGDAALLPQLVNAHVHLEFSHLREPLPVAQPFTTWIRALVQERRARDAADYSAIRAGLRESAAAGTGVLGEIATQDWPLPEVELGAAQLVVFRELLGLSPEWRAEQLTIAERHLSVLGSGKQPGVIAGLSPHAPYSVHPDLYRDLVRLAATAGAPLAIHLAETQSELELLARGTGEFVEMLSQFGVWRPDLFERGGRVLDYLQPLADLPHALAIHGNYLGPDDLSFLAEHRNITVVYCPRTHRYFGHPPHPWLELLQRGASVALGTDGRGSNADLSLWREVQFLHATFPAVDSARLLQLATLDGASALGLDEEFGSLTPGKRAALLAVPLQDGSLATLLRGEPVPLEGLPAAL